MSMMLAGASWAIFAVRPIVRRTWRWLVLLAVLAAAYAQGLTGGRMGYLTWGIVGLILCLVRWRKALLLIPVIAGAVLLVIPGTADRLLQGFTAESRDTNVKLEAAGIVDPAGQGLDVYTITAGRNVAWPHVVAKILESPITLIIGYGNRAMLRSGLGLYLYDTYGELFPHPHNAYLELVFDTGLVGFLIVIPFFGMVLSRAFSLFRDSSSPVFVAVGGVGCSLILAMMVAGFGSQTFFPREGYVGMWCAMMLVLRLSVQREHTLPVVRRRARSFQRGPAPHRPSANGSPGGTVNGVNGAVRPQQTPRPSRDPVEAAIWEGRA
jgi:O-antigen ligase